MFRKLNKDFKAQISIIANILIIQKRIISLIKYFKIVEKTISNINHKWNSKGNSLKPNWDKEEYKREFKEEKIIEARNSGSALQFYK